MVKTHKGADAEEVKASQVVGGAICLCCHGHGLGRPIQEVDGDVIPGGIGSLDALARERLESQHGRRWHHRDWSQKWQERCRWRRKSERESPQLGAIKVAPTFEDGVAVRMKDCYRCLVKNNLQPWLVKDSRLMRVRGKDGMTWPNIVAGGRAETKASIALATERLGHPFATVMPMVGAHRL
jgi:hypothetical protein